MHDLAVEDAGVVVFVSLQNRERVLRTHLKGFGVQRLAFEVENLGFGVESVRGYLAHMKTQPPRTLPQAYARGPRGILGGWAFSFQ